MFKKVSPYIGEYKKYTVFAVICMSLGIVASVLPYFFVYQLLGPLLRGEELTSQYALIRIAAILVCEILFAVLYVQGLTFSHISAYNTLKNLRTSLQGKLEKQPLGNIKDIGTGRLKKVFIDDIDQIELLLAHAIPEGIANIFIPVLIIVIMFVANWKLGLLSMVPIVVGLFAMGMMMKAGYSQMNAYYESATKMNNTIIEYVNGMEVVKVFNKDGDSYKRFGEVVRNYRDFTIKWFKVCWPWMATYTSVLPCLVILILPIGSLMVLSGAITLDKLVFVICLSFAVGPSFLKALNFAGKFPQLDYKITELEKCISDGIVDILSIEERFLRLKKASSLMPVTLQEKAEFIISTLETAYLQMIDFSEKENYLRQVLMDNHDKKNYVLHSNYIVLNNFPTLFLLLLQYNSNQLSYNFQFEYIDIFHLVHNSHNYVYEILIYFYFQFLYLDSIFLVLNYMLFDF